MKDSKYYNSKEQYEKAHNYIVVKVSKVGDVYVQNFTSRKSAENSDICTHDGEVMTRTKFETWKRKNEAKFATGEYHLG